MIQLNEVNMRRIKLFVTCCVLVGLVNAALCSSKEGDTSASEDTSTTTCKCGWVNKGRIVGGSVTVKNAYPMMVDLANDYGHYCGGTIITPWHVLTAAHCTNVEQANTTYVRVGAYKLNENDLGRYRVEKIIEHELFNPTYLTNDIALIVMAEEIKFDHNVGPACMPTRKLSIVGQSLKALGWGYTYTNAIFGSNVLLEVDLQVIPLDRCKRIWHAGEAGAHHGQNMCTYSDGKDTCNGDSGGPLLWLHPKTKRYTLAALVSKGAVCAGATPAINTDVSSYLDWINYHIEETKPGVKTCVKKPSAPSQKS